MLHRRRIRSQVEVARGSRDVPGHLDVLVAQPTGVAGEKPHRHAIAAEVDVDLMARGRWELADRPHQRGTRAERPGPEVRARPAATPQGAPTVGTGQLVELLARDLIAHDAMLSTSTDNAVAARSRGPRRRLPPLRPS